jgi:hypothetical protein
MDGKNELLNTQMGSLECFFVAKSRIGASDNDSISLEGSGGRRRRDEELGLEEEGDERHVVVRFGDLLLSTGNCS